MLKLHRLKFFLGPKNKLELQVLWVKNKEEMNLFENIHSFEVVEVFNLNYWLDLLQLDYFFIFFGHCAYGQCIGIPMDANGVVYSTIFYIFSYEFYFFKHLLKNNTCPFVLHELSFVCRFVDDLVILNFSNFESFMYLDQDSFSEITCSQKHLVG